MGAQALCPPRWPREAAGTLDLLVAIRALPVEAMGRTVAPGTPSPYSSRDALGAHARTADSAATVPRLGSVGNSPREVEGSAAGLASLAMSHEDPRLSRCPPTWRPTFSATSSTGP